MINISETKQTEEALLLSEEKFAKAFHASLDGLLLSRQSDGLIIEINEGFSRLIGYDSASALYHSTLELQLWVDPRSVVTCSRSWKKRLCARLHLPYPAQGRASASL